ncbi:hypothetical protein ACH5RR_029253 [Cinchona calisaya]|uniref:Transposase n=1 Tax=Cinchona calisaya TaxID=153742 RepID=A0ABD2YVK6_9GENT
MDFYGQKGLVEAINIKVPHAVNRKCCRHILSNFRCKYLRVMLNKLFSRAVRSYTEQGLKEAMAQMKDLKLEAYEWLCKIPFEFWTRHAFQANLKNDHIIDNIAESLNKWVGVLRGKPILILMKTLRSKGNE